MHFVLSFFKCSCFVFFFIQKCWFYANVPAFSKNITQNASNCFWITKTKNQKEKLLLNTSRFGSKVFWLVKTPGVSLIVHESTQHLLVQTDFQHLNITNARFSTFSLNKLSTSVLPCMFESESVDTTKIMAGRLLDKNYTQYLLLCNIMDYMVFQSLSVC